MLVFNILNWSNCENVFTASNSMNKLFLGGSHTSIKHQVCRTGLPQAHGHCVPHRSSRGREAAVGRGGEQTCFMASTLLLSAVVCSMSASAALSCSRSRSTSALASASAFSMLQLISGDKGSVGPQPPGHSAYLGHRGCRGRGTGHCTCFWQSETQSETMLYQLLPF